MCTQCPCVDALRSKRADSEVGDDEGEKTPRRKRSDRRRVRYRGEEMDLEEAGVLLGESAHTLACHFVRHHIGLQEVADLEALGLDKPRRRGRRRKEGTNDEKQNMPEGRQ